MSDAIFVAKKASLKIGDKKEIDKVAWESRAGSG